MYKYEKKGSKKDEQDKLQSISKNIACHRMPSYSKIMPSTTQNGDAVQKHSKNTNRRLMHMCNSVLHTAHRSQVVKFHI